jgi:hypothetical protein
VGNLELFSFRNSVLKTSHPPYTLSYFLGILKNNLLSFSEAHIGCASGGNTGPMWVGGPGGVLGG